jgi:hypothetical protein
MQNLSTLALAIGLSALAGSSQLMAQDIREKGDIPFAFQVGDKTLVAGTYTVARTQLNGVITLCDEETRTMMMTPLQVPAGQNRNNQSKLVFRKYGDRYFLAEVWFADDSVVHALPKSKLEKEYAYDIHVGKPQIVYLSMR